MEGNDALQTVINTCNRYGIDWRQCPSYKELTQSDIDRSRLMKDARFRTEVAEEIRLWANQWSLKETGKELFPKSFRPMSKQQPQYNNSWKNIAGKLSESKLRKIISKVIKESLGYGEEYYICSETDYNGGKVDYWIGNKSEAEECNQCSEGSAIGPFSSYGEALDYANENGMSIPDPDNEVPKFSKSEKQGDEISRLYNNYSLTGQLPSDEDIKRVARISESKIRKAISESIKKVLKEGEFDTMDWDYAANSSNELEDKSFTPFNGEGFQKRVYDNDDRQEILWAIKHFLTNDISSDAARIFERNEQLWQAAWENVDAYFGSDKEEFIRQAEQMRYSLPNGWTLDDVFNVVKDVKMGLQRSDTLAESKRTIKLNESQLRNIISKSV